MNLPISIRGARQHNLRNLDLDLPSNKLIVFCGPSGSGKSSLAFDTLFSESRRRFLDCLSARSRQGMDQPEKPEVDSITGLPPALCLEQSARQQSSRTLLGNITEILDYLRILYAAAGTPHDPETGKELERKSPDRITEELVSLPEHTRLILAAPAENLLAQDPAATLGDFQRQGFLRVYWNGEMRDIEEISSPVPRLRTRPWSLTASSSEGKIRPRALRIPCKRLSVSIRTRFGPSSPYQERKPQSGPSTPATAIRKQASFCPSLRPAIFPSTPRWGHAPPAGEPA